MKSSSALNLFVITLFFSASHLLWAGDFDKLENKFDPGATDSGATQVLARYNQIEQGIESLNSRSLCGPADFEGEQAHTQALYDEFVLSIKELEKKGLLRLRSPHITGFRTRTYTLDVLNQDKRVIGEVTLIKHGFAGKSKVHLHMIKIVEEHQQKGIGTQVLKSLIELCDQPALKIKTITLSVGSSIPVAGLIYGRLGFEPNLQGLEQLSKLTGKPMDRVRAEFFKDSRAPESLPQPSDASTQIVKKWDIIYPDPEGEFSKAFNKTAFMVRENGAKSFAVSTKASIEEVQEAYFKSKSE